VTKNCAKYENIRAVTFDAVGTLIHPDPPAAEVYAVVGRAHGSRLGIDAIRQRFAVAFAEQERLDAANGWATSEERERRRWQAIVGQVLDDVVDPGACFAELYEHFARPGGWRCEPGAGELLARLIRAGYAIAVASNYDHRLRAVVAGLDALSPIDVLVISSEAGWRKPGRNFFAHVAGSLGLLQAAVLHVGDDPINDFEGARQAGLGALLFDPHSRHVELGGERLASLRELQLPELSGEAGLVCA
jgi:putative hydrolase of the HAD superfamily